MGRSKKSSGLGCVFGCFGAKKKKRQGNEEEEEDEKVGEDHPPIANGNREVVVANGGGGGGRGRKGALRSNGGGGGSGRRAKINGAERKRVTIREDGAGGGRPRRPQSPVSRAGSAASSARSSVYFDANDGHGDENGNSGWEILNGDDDDDDFDVDDEKFFESFEQKLQIDGQYFFSAMDDPTLTREAFEGIQLYPPIPTAAIDPPPPRCPVDVSDMRTLSRAYQHSGDDEDARRVEEEADAAYERAGEALEHQAERLMMSVPPASARDMRTSADYLGESTDRLLGDLKIPNVREKGFPGELTESELEAVKRFRSELGSRDPVYGQIVGALGSVEQEAYALCRWLRARKFDVDKVFELLEGARGHYEKAREQDFYPDLERALGFSRAVFLSQYPAVFSGNAKNGCPVMYLQLGNIQPEGIKCIISLDRADRFFWNDMMHAFPPVLKFGRTLNPNFVRTENLTIYDLKGVSRAQITSDTFEMIKVANQVMASFPETLHCLLIINAPSWFGFVWSVVKKIIDPRTASKIEVFTNAKSGGARMRELIDESQIPSNYGGAGPSLSEAASGASAGGAGASRGKMVVLNELLTLPKKNVERSCEFELVDSEDVTLTIYTRCATGATAKLFRAESDVPVAEIDLEGGKEGGDDVPYSRTIGAIQGPGSFTVKLKAKNGSGCFLCLGTTRA